MTWSITHAGTTWSEADLTVQHAVLITDGLGTDTWDFNPAGGPRKLVSVLAAFIAAAESKPLVQVMFELSTVPLATLLAGLQVVEE